MKTRAKPHGNRYPWDDWLDGRERKIRRGVDFDCEPASMGVIVRLAARRRAVCVSVYVAGSFVRIVPCP